MKEMMVNVITTSHSHFECFRIVPNISLNLEQGAQRNQLRLDPSNAKRVHAGHSRAEIQLYNPAALM